MVNDKVNGMANVLLNHLQELRNAGIQAVEDFDTQEFARYQQRQPVLQTLRQ